METGLDNINWENIRTSEKYRELICKKICEETSLKEGIADFIKKNSGTETEVEEVFQDSIVRFFDKIMKDKTFTIEKDIKGYIFGIAKNVFIFNRKKANKLNIKNEVDEFVFISEEDKLSIYTNKEIFKTILSHSTETCKKVLMYWSYSYSMGEIAELMNYQSEMMARKKKHECLKKLIELFKANQKLKNQILGS
jgi:DNA-directed RNA polymerase specialized sigma24 family protein